MSAPAEPPVGATIVDAGGHEWRRDERGWSCACDTWFVGWSWDNVWADANKPIKVRVP